MNKNKIILILITVIIVSGGVVFTKYINKNMSLAVMTLYKDPNCGCCTGYAAALRNIGVKVNVVQTDNMAEIKNKYNINPEQQSCHTITYNNYFIEGHVPMEAVLKLIKTQPDVDGIGLPRMPSGTPGMPGPKYAPYKVFQMKDGRVDSFMTI